MPLGFTDRQRIPESYQVAKVNNLLWMIQFSILPKSTAMWVGWNAQHRIDKKATEKIWYLPAINQSITNIDSWQRNNEKGTTIGRGMGKT